MHTCEDGDFGATSVIKEWSNAAPISKVDRHISDRVLYATLLCSVNRALHTILKSFSCRHENCELKRRQREQQKTNKFRLAKQRTLHVNHAFLYISLSGKRSRKPYGLVFSEELHVWALPMLHVPPVQPSGHKHRYPFLVKPDWHVPLFWQGELEHAFWKKKVWMLFRRERHYVSELF